MSKVKLFWYPERFITETKKTYSDKLDKVGKIVAEEAHRIAPVDTGDLSNSIDYTRMSEEVVRVGGATEYAIFVELGTSKMPAQSYLRRGLDNSRKVIQRIFKTK